MVEPIQVVERSTLLSTEARAAFSRVLNLKSIAIAFYFCLLLLFGRFMMSLYYERELNLKEIGKVMDVSESRVCQIHGQALVRLRARLGDWAGVALG